MKIGERARQFDEIHVDMTPMIDVTFLLIIFFITVQTLTRVETAAQLELPAATQAVVEQNPDPGRLVINVAKNGDIYIMGQRRSDAEIQAILANEARRSIGPDGFSTRSIIIRGDAHLRYGRVQWLMKQCLQRGIWKLHLAVQPPE